MQELEAKAVILDIEGTCSAKSYLCDVLFPFARENTRSYLERCWDEQNTLEACDQIARETGRSSSYDWLCVFEKRSEQIDAVVTQVNKLMEENSNSRGLKELQGFIWAEAYSSGLLCSQVFVDVPQALACWRAGKVTMAIYDAAVSTAQRVFFKHTEFGDLSDYFAGFFDTSSGAKSEPESYKRIARLLGQEPAEIVYFSDCEKELDVAKNAGLQTVMVARPENNQTQTQNHISIPSFYDVRIVESLASDPV